MAIPAPILAIAIAALLSGSGKKSSFGTSISGSPTWPLRNNSSKNIPSPSPQYLGRGFGAGRPYSNMHQCDRVHGGVDLSAVKGDICVAMEDGIIVVTQGWDGDNAKAILLETANNVLLYGAVAPNSWKEFNVGVGSKVKRGQRIARIGTYSGGSQMLHFELYKKGTKKNAVWCKGKPKPSNMIDPTSYLKKAAGSDALS